MFGRKKFYREKSGLTVKRLDNVDKRNRNISGKVENKSVCYGMNRQILDRFAYSACWHSNHSYSGWWGGEPNQGLNVEGLTLPSALLHA